MADPVPFDGELLDECGELLAGLKADIPGVRGPSPDRETLVRMQRHAHTAKGLIGFLRDPEMEGLASRLAEDLRRLRDGEAELTQDSVDEIAVHTAKLTELLAAAEIHPRPAPRDTRATKVFSKAAETTAAVRFSSWDEFQASACRGNVDMLSKAIVEVLTTFDVGGAVCAEHSVGECLATTHDLTVVVNARESLDAAIILEFDRDAAMALARRMAAAMTGEEVEVTSNEEAEFVRGALGEVVNFTLLATLKALDLPPKVVAPRFVDGRGVTISAGPRALRRFSVETELGGFDVGYVPGAALCEGLDVPSEEKAGGPGSRGRVVVAEDSVIMRKMVERILVGGGYEIVAHARDGREAVEQFRRHRPDLVTMDINMPVMGGLDALRIIRAEDPKALVLICSAVTDEAIKRHGLASGAVGYITKPFNSQTLLDAVRYLMEQGAAKSGPAERVGSAAPDVDSLGIYRVEELLGEGGMALVYKGHDPGLGRGVALKVIQDRYSGDVDLVVRFLEEARAVARVSHPNVVSIYFAGSDKGKHFFAMELLPGPDLEELVYRDGPLTPREAFAYIRQGALGLAAAERQGLIHCDVKPSNLVFGSDGMVKVTDFGIAQQLGTEDNPTISEMVGTPCFMSPEQVMEGAIDHRADIYSLGVTLYFLLTGDPPYDGDDGVEVALRHVHDPVPRLPKGPMKLNRLLGRMMAKSPDARHGDYEELLSDIDRLLL